MVNTRVVSRQHTSFYHRRSPELEAVSSSPLNPSSTTAYTARVQSSSGQLPSGVAALHLVTPSKLIIIVSRYTPDHQSLSFCGSTVSWPLIPNPRLVIRSETLPAHHHIA